MRYTFIRTLYCAAICLFFIATLLAYEYRPDEKIAAGLIQDGVLTERTRALISGGDAYILAPLETVAEVTRLDKIAVASDYSAALIVALKRRPQEGGGAAWADGESTAPRTPHDLVLIHWDVRTRTARTLLREMDGEGVAIEILNIDWLPRSRVALVTRRRWADGNTTYTLLRVDTAAGTVRWLADSDSDISLTASPRHPLAYAENMVGEGKDGSSRSLQVYTEQGRGRVIPVDAETGTLKWTLDGGSLYATKRWEQVPGGKRTARNVLTLINLRTGAVTHPPKLPTVHDDAPLIRPRPMDFLGTALTAALVPGPSEQTQEITALWLRGEGKATDGGGAKLPNLSPPAAPAKRSGAAPITDALLVATNAEPQAFLANRNSAAVLFLREGVLCAAPVYRLSRAAYETGMLRAQQEATTRNARHVGLGIMQYIQDYDENYPMPGTTAEKAIELYLRNKAAFQNPATGEHGFFYTYTGSTVVGEMTSPATTQLGYISGPSGKAIIWADGHATWQDDPPTP